MQKNWNSLSELLQAFNQNCNYLILRNYENISDENYYLEGHDDIDFLCDNQKKLIYVSGAKRSLTETSVDHLFIKIKGVTVKIGIRYVGDNYYDKNWEKKMLDSRIYNEAGFYTMNPENYYYSLIYHALLQKKHMAEDYQNRLTIMGEVFNDIGKDEEDWFSVLQNYMKKNNYKITAPLDAIVPMRKDLIFKLPKDFYVGWDKQYFQGRRVYWLGVKIRVILKAIKRRLLWVKK